MCRRRRLGERVRDRTVGEMVDAAAAAGAPVRLEAEHVTVETVAGITTTLGGLRVDEHAACRAGRVRLRGGCRRDRDGRLRERARGGTRVRADRRPGGAGGDAVSADRGATRSGTVQPFGIGLEEELLLVDPRSFRLAHTADRILPRIDLPDGPGGPRGLPRQLELRSEPRGSASEAVAQLEEGRAVAREAGATLLAAGVHPDAEYGDVRLVRSERYRRVRTRCAA